MGRGNLWSLPSKLNICIKKNSNANSSHLNKKAPTLGCPVPLVGTGLDGNGGRRLKEIIPKCFELCRLAQMTLSGGLGTGDWIAVGLGIVVPG